jgi:biopolymer transport protein TolR
MAEINVTPFVDVMLVLLIVFMVTAPLLVTGVTVDLPEAQTKPLPGQDEPISVSVKKDGSVHVLENEVTLEQLAARLEAISGENPDVRIFVRGDREVPYGDLMNVVSSLHYAGFRKVALVTLPVQAGS